MKVEHLTVMGNSMIRDSHDIDLKTLDVLKKFQFRKGATVLDFPLTELKVKITSTDEGAMFDIRKGENIAFTNACCFDRENRETILDLVRDLSGRLPFIKQEIVREPKMDQFLYSIPVAPFLFSPDEIMMAGEVEFYIYYSLYLARRNG